MITVLSQPGTISFSRNPIIYRMSTNNRYENTGLYEKPDVSIDFSSSDWGGTGDTMELTFGDTTLSFQCVATPAARGDIKRYTTGDYEDWLDGDFCQGLRSLREFDENYTVVRYTPAPGVFIMIIEAREYDVSFNITASFDGASINPSPTSNDGTDIIYRENFSILIRVYKYNALSDTDFYNATLIHEETQTPDSNNSCRFELAEILDSYLQNDTPLYVQDAPYDANTSVVKYFIMYAESYGSPPEAQYLVRGTDKYVFLGGVSKAEFPTSTLISDIQASFGKFLTHLPDNRTVSRSQKNYLAFHTKFINDTVYVGIQLNYSDGTSEQDRFNSIAIDEGVAKIIIPCGFDQLALSDYEDDDVTVKSYKIWIEKEDETRISEERTFIIDTKYRRQEKYFIYSNSLGGFDTFRATGKYVSSFDPKSIIGQRNLPYDYKAKDAERVKYGTEYTTSIDLTTGFISKDLKKSLQEIRLSEQVFEDIINQFISIIVPDAQVQVDDVGASLKSDKFVYQYAFVDTQLSKLL